jgi:4-diphosphocytidyl-2C-methyl-D-erythritol kinase
MAKELISPDEPDIKARFMAAFAAPESADWDFLCRNDLAPALWEKFPLLGLLRDELSAAGALTVQVSGSGSSLFTLFNGNAAAAAEKLHDKFGGMAGLRILTGGREW